MKVGREDAAVEKDAAVEAVEKPAMVIAAAVGAAEGAVTATGGGAPSAMTAPAAIAAVEPAVGEQVEEEVAVDVEEQRLKRKRELCRSTNTQEDDEDVDDSKESRDSKSRYVLRRLRNGEIPYRSGYNRLYGNIACPFCCTIIKSDYDSLIMHGTYIDRGNGRNRKPHVRDKHAAFGAFLRKYAKGHLPFYLPRPPRPAKMPRI
ncbi:hypothetical protein VPH35_017567 [Triticum aestivum]